MTSLPRIVIAAPGTGHGKTTVTTGLIAALARERPVSGHKVGPDFIDPGYHCLASGRPGRNLDPHLVGEGLIDPLLLHGARGADIAVIEGVMGLYDGRIGTAGASSTAHVAALTRTPVVLVVDISRSSRTIGALVHGLATWSDEVEIAGVILNQGGSPRHVQEVREAIDVPVLGALPRAESVTTPSRHLGLVPAAERAESAATLKALTDLISEHVDLDAIEAIARSAPDLDSIPWDPADHVTPIAARPTIAVAGGRAFTFRYAETDELLTAAGAHVVTFDPLTERLPEGTDALYLGGGFPEVYAPELAENTALLDDVRRAVTAGMPTVAECAGMLYLCKALDGTAMAGVLDAEAGMAERLTLRYPEAVAAHDTLLTRRGEVVTGHEFHRTAMHPAVGAQPAWIIEDEPLGFATDTVHASYLHVHWAGYPDMAQRFVEAASG